MKPITIAVTIWILSLATGCGNQSIVRLVFPDGFLGVVVIEDSVEANPVERFNRTFRIMIPKSGIVQLRSTRFFENWHVLKGEYISGKRLQNGEEIENPVRDKAYLWSLFTTETRCYFMVGTPDQHKKMRAYSEKQLRELLR